MKQTQHAISGTVRILSVLSLVTLLGACANTGNPPVISAPKAPASSAPAAPKTSDVKAATAPRKKPELAAASPAQAPRAAAEGSAAADLSTPISPAEAKDLWDRMRKGFAMPALDSPLVAEKERFYLSQPAYLQRMMTRGGRYLFFIVEELEARNMPLELALLPFVESAMNPVALSSAKAAGLWQFIPSTGRAYDLNQNWWVDNRRDVVKSTRAALDYLQKIYVMNGNDWFLALASYNWGEGSVMRAVKTAKGRGLSGDYLSLNMPNETRHYVPKLMALKNILMRAEELNITLPVMPNKPYFVTIEKTRPIDLKLAAKFAGMSVDEFVALNPAHNRPVIAASKNNEIKLPADRVDGFLAAVKKHSEENRVMASWQPYTVKPGESLSQVASRGGVSETELRNANGLRTEARILPGTKLLAPHAEVADESKVESFVAPRVYESVSVPAQYHTVGRKDSLISIAHNYGLSVATLKAWNGIKKTAARGMNLLVRPSYAQTVLTEESGQRQVVSSQAAPKMVAVAAKADEAEKAEKADRVEKAAEKAAEKAEKATTDRATEKAAEKAAEARQARAAAKQPAPAAKIEREAKADKAGKAKLAANGKGKVVPAAQEKRADKGKKAEVAAKATKTPAAKQAKAKPEAKVKAEAKSAKASGKKTDKNKKA